MNTSFYIGLLIATLTLTQLTAAKPQPVRAFLASDKMSECIVGQKVSVVVEVFSPTYFSGSTRFTIPDIAGAVFYKPEERAVVRSQMIDGVTYSVQRHEFSFYAQRPGNYKIPAFRVRFATNPGAAVATEKKQKTIQQSELTEPIQIKANMPPGAEHLKSLISASDLKVTETWSPNNQTTYTAGNALQRKITFKAPDMPGMVFPALPIPQIDGIRIYRERAQINDRINRGALTGERTEKITYVFQQPGDYTLPEIQITWWGLQHHKLQLITLPAQSFEVLPAPIQNDEDAASPTLSSRLSWPTIAIGSLIILCLGGGVYWSRSRIMDVVTTWQQQRQESESAYFHKITADLSPSATHHAITRWLAHTTVNQDHIPTLSDWARHENNEDLLTHAEALQRAVVDPHSTWDANALIKALKTSRTKQRGKRSSHRITLPPLNPDHP